MDYVYVQLFYLPLERKDSFEQSHESSTTTEVCDGLECCARLIRHFTRAGDAHCVVFKSRACFAGKVNYEALSSSSIEIIN
jgi:hypothetical protein